MGFVRALRGRRWRLALNALSLVFALAVGTLAVLHFSDTGWPLAGADLRLVAVAGVFFLAAFALLAAALRSARAADLARARSRVRGRVGDRCGSSGGRVDDAVRIAVVRRYSAAGVGTLCLSLFMLGLIDTVALMPLASAAAATRDASLAVRIGLGIIAFAGLGAAVVVFALAWNSGRRLVAARAVA